MGLVGFVLNLVLGFGIRLGRVMGGSESLQPAVLLLLLQVDEAGDTALEVRLLLLLLLLDVVRVLPSL